MAEDAGGGVGSGGDFLEVGAADAAGVDFDQDFAGADFGDGDGFEADVVDAAIDGGQHGARDFALAPGWALIAQLPSGFKPRCAWNATAWNYCISQGAFAQPGAEIFRGDLGVAGEAEDAEPEPGADGDVEDEAGGVELCRRG